MRLISPSEKPIASIEAFCISSKTPASLSLSHWPETLLSARFSDFSCVSSRSTTTTLSSVYPKSFATLKRWCPPTIFPVRLFQTIGSTQPKVSMDCFRASYMGSPGSRATRGLYGAGFICLNGILSILIFSIRIILQSISILCRQQAITGYMPAESINRPLLTPRKKSAPVALAGFRNALV